MEKQTTDTILMVEPIAFGFNTQTAENNHFQKNDATDKREIQKLALSEFQAMVAMLRSYEIQVIVINDTVEPHTPDSIFPNNWFSMHGSKIAIYPMYAKNRRFERRSDILSKIKECGFNYQTINDYSYFEKQGIYLEGTGSMILDRVNKIAYAAISERTDKVLFRTFCSDFGYLPVSYIANQTVGEERLPIYHTNVQLCVADKYVVVCLQAIDNLAEREFFVNTVFQSGKELIEITEAQMHQFAGNMLQVRNIKGEQFLVMSQTAYRSLTEQQINKLESYNRLLVAAVPTIEKYGGGSVRCMMAEIF